MKTKEFTWLTLGVLLGGFFLFIYFIKDSYLALPRVLQSERPFNAAQDWREFKALKGDFKVSFPALPQQAIDTVTDPKTNEKRKYDMYVSETANGTIFMVSLITLMGPGPINKESTELMKEYMNQMLVNNPKNKLQSVGEEIYKGLKSLTFTIVNDEVTMDGKEFIKDNTLYFLITISKNGNYSNNESKHFFDSFEFLDVKQHPAVTPFPPQN